ncbi:MFS transporter [Methanogenium sp. MK-MG]|uniref:MFS transporter n=1 Tax=Methanogenium sp. MK-MG TaxID=2599926 RepID=UPI0013EA288F|nr:MFS transporter [Methanogenium sp. MK-MG]
MTHSADNKKHETTPDKNRARLALLILASMMTMMGASAVAPSLPGISAAFSGYPESMVTMIVTLPSLAIVLTGWCIGLICDRVGKTRLLMVSLALFALFGSSGAYLSSLEMILLGRAFLGVAIAGIMTTTTALISTYYTGRERARAIGYQSAGMGLGALVLEVSGGYLASIDWRATFVIYLIALLFIPGIFLTMKEPEQRTKDSGETGAHFENEPAHIPVGQIGLILTGLFGVMLMFYMVPTKLPYLLQDAGITSTLLYGVLLGVPGFVQVFSALSSGRLNTIFSKGALVSSGFFFMAAGSLVIAGVSELTFLVGGLVLTGIGMGLVITMLIGWLSEVTPPHRYGIVFGLYSVFFFMGQFVSGFVAQPLIDMSGSYHTVFVFNGIVGIVLAMAFVCCGVWENMQKRTGRHHTDS